jgi:hypothetical protein
MKKFVVILLLSVVGLATITSCTYMKTQKPCHAHKVGNHR